MKRQDLVKRLTKGGWWLARHGANHDIYTNGEKTEPIERHNEIPEQLAQKILKRNGL